MPLILSDTLEQSTVTVTVPVPLLATAYKLLAQDHLTLTPINIIIIPR